MWYKEENVQYVSSNRICHVADGVASVSATSPLEVAAKGTKHPDPSGSIIEGALQTSMLYGAMNSPVRPVLDEIAQFAEMGFDYLELTMDPPSAHCDQIAAIGDTLRAALADHRMGLVCHMPTFVSLADLNDTIRSACVGEVCRAMAVAATLAPMKIVVHPAHISGMGVHVLAQSRRHAYDSLAAIVDTSDRLNQTICLENMFPRVRFGVEPEEFEPILNQFPQIRLTLDVGHAHIESDGARRILRFVDMFAERIDHIHLSDNFGRDDQHLPIGAGSIPYRSVIDALKQIGFDRTATFEIFSPDRDYLQISKDKFQRLWQKAA